jgi:hypothetical protein
VEGWTRNSVKEIRRMLTQKASRIRKRYRGLIYADAAEVLARSFERAATEFDLCPYPGGKYENGRLVGKHAEDCMCNFDGAVR